MPRGSVRKQPCNCGHGKAIHHRLKVVINNTYAVRSACNHPNCKCADYKLEFGPRGSTGRNFTT